MTQAAVAAKIKVQVAAVSNWETGSRFPSRSNLKQLSKLFKITIPDLFLMCEASSKKAGA